ncbi:hypothetical protein CHARACLAT_030016 [Characodon lateralis]|uniref:Uncharacterized protein n=1 Tax=Characodon lateralis TaxID=208331 RepID=A0ABU7E4R6_9TELE|nr:hypothetical protein [Characodon lateralis]
MNFTNLFFIGKGSQNLTQMNTDRKSSTVSQKIKLKEKLQRQACNRVRNIERLGMPKDVSARSRPNSRVYGTGENTETDWHVTGAQLIMVAVAESRNKTWLRLNRYTWKQ